MLLKGFGEVITTALTVNPALADLPSASSILDTSNYTFQAVTFGKDAQGFTQHAHVVSSTQYVDGDSASGASAYDHGRLVIINYGSTLATSSYVTSATYLHLSSTYNSVLNYPTPLDTRLERGSTSATHLSDYQYASAIPNLGHYVNPPLNNQLSAVWNKVGGFGPSTTSEYYLYDNTSSFTFSGEVSSYFNGNAIMDKDGYLTFNPKSVQGVATLAAEASAGAVLVSSTTYSVSGGNIIVSVVVQDGDACTLAAFGGIKHVGVYCIDLQQMLSSGLLPPYDWNALNNTRKYKLVATVTTLDDVLYHRDFLTYSGFENILNKNALGVFSYGGPNINLIFDFK